MSDTGGPRQIDLLVEHGTVITVDGERRVIEDGAVAVLGQVLDRRP